MGHERTGEPADMVGELTVDVSDGVATVDRTTADRNPATVVHAIVASVASASGEDLLDLPPLYDVIDPEALRLICSGGRSDGTESTVTVSFEYADHLVEVTGCETATASPLE